ncbi:MAG: hypothetical protein EAZ90_14445 [Oscillatoriales cyanobacterium]|nr:MAG: hypothetical protein EAZ90_14445 [Oscillatoriales cyanobacterium]
MLVNSCQSQATEFDIAVLKRGEVCPMPYALCPMPYALCPMPYALCPMPYAPFPKVQFERRAAII